MSEVALWVGRIMTLIPEMMSGGYRFKSRRGKPGVLVLRRGQHGMEPVPELKNWEADA